MSRQKGFQLLALSVLASVALSGCSKDFKLSPPPLEIASVELVPIGAGSTDVCRIAVEVRNPGSNELTDQFDDDEIAMSIELRAVSALGLDYGIDAGVKTVPAGETVEFSPADTILGADVYSYTITLTRDGEPEVTEPDAGEAEQFVKACEK